MPKFACALVAYLAFATTVLAAASPDCPQWAEAHENAIRARALVCEGDVARLESYFQQRHREYEAGVIDGGQLLWSYDQLWQPFPYAKLEEWLKRYPDSYPAHLALSEALIHRAHRVNGSGAPWYMTPQKLFATYSLRRQADSYLHRSLALNRKPYLSYYYLIRADRLTHPASSRSVSVVPRPAAKEYLEKAAQLDGPAFVARAAYMISLQPVWGGNAKAMRRHYEDSLNVGLTDGQLARFRAMVLFEESRLMDVDKQAEARLKLAVEANTLDEDGRYLRDIIWLKVRAKRWADAMPDLDRAMELDPRDEWARRYRGTALFALNRHAEAYKEFRICADKGDAFSQNKVGWYLTMGVGVPQNKHEGAQWFAKAAAGGDKDGINNLKQAKAERSI